AVVSDISEHLTAAQSSNSEQQDRKGHLSCLCLQPVGTCWNSTHTHTHLAHADTTSTLIMHTHTHTHRLMQHSAQRGEVFLSHHEAAHTHTQTQTHRTTHHTTHTPTQRHTLPHSFK